MSASNSNPPANSVPAITSTLNGTTLKSTPPSVTSSCKVVEEVSLPNFVKENFVGKSVMGTKCLECETSTYRSARKKILLSPLWFWGLVLKSGKLKSGACDLILRQFNMLKIVTRLKIVDQKSVVLHKRTVLWRFLSLWFQILMDPKSLHVFNVLWLSIPTDKVFMFGLGVAVVTNFAKEKVLLCIGGGADLAQNLWDAAKPVGTVFTRTIVDGKTPDQYPRKNLSSW